MMKVTEYIRSKGVRLAAFLLCMLCAGIMAETFFDLVKLDDLQAVFEDKSTALSREAAEIYQQVSWLENLYSCMLSDETKTKGSASLSEEAKTELRKELEEAGFLKDGKLNYTNEHFDFYIEDGAYRFSNVNTGENAERYFSDQARYPVMWSGDGAHLDGISGTQESDIFKKLFNSNYTVILPGGMLYDASYGGLCLSDNLFGAGNGNFYTYMKEGGSELFLDEAGKEKYLDGLVEDCLKEGTLVPAPEEGKYAIQTNLLIKWQEKFGCSIEEWFGEQDEEDEEDDAWSGEIQADGSEQEKLYYTKDEIKRYIENGLYKGATERLTMVIRNGMPVFEADEWEWDAYGTVYAPAVKIYLAPKKAYVASVEKAYKTSKAEGRKYLDKMARLFVILLLLLFYLIYATGYSRDLKKYTVTGMDKRVHMEFVVAAFFLFLFLGAASVTVLAEGIAGNEWGIADNAYLMRKTQLLFAAAVSLCLAGLLGAFLSVVRRFRTGYKRSLLRGFCHCMKKGAGQFAETVKTAYLLYVNTMTERQMVLLCLLGGATVIIAFFSVAMLENGEIGFFLLLCLIWGLFFIWWFIRMTRHMQEIEGLGKQIDALYRGNYEPVSVPEDSIVAEQTDKLNHLSEGMKTAVEKQVAAEKMKIDLITNVSHDLKTPLTSIISYVDLLAKEELQPEAADYVRILEDKAARLSQIVSDVFDLAKASSGAEIHLERLDGSMLLKQVLADMEDQIRESGRTVKEAITVDSFEIMGDGQKLYRVFQNLLDNALKYSMEGTRIFVTLKAEAARLELEVKNIASYEMDFSAEEIVERFSRGDKARTTEGNGLGLSIAQNFTYACGGSFDVQIDGDMFKVRVSFPPALPEGEA